LILESTKGKPTQRAKDVDKELADGLTVLNTSVLGKKALDMVKEGSFQEKGLLMKEYLRTISEKDLDKQHMLVEILSKVHGKRIGLTVTERSSTKVRRLKSVFLKWTWPFKPMVKMKYRP
jgi:hypothetical protein